MLSELIPVVVVAVLAVVRFVGAVLRWRAARNGRAGAGPAIHIQIGRFEIGRFEIDSVQCDTVPRKDGRR